MDFDIEQMTKEKTEVLKPKNYAVMILNDDYTPMEFVIEILKSIFNKNDEEAERITLLVHQTGQGLAGIYKFDIAETKAYQCVDLARKNQLPLNAQVVEAD